MKAKFINAVNSAKIAQPRAAGLLAPLIAALAVGGATPLAHAATAATTSLAPYFTVATKTPSAPDKDGFIRRWLLLEPISKPNRSNSGFTGSYVRRTLIEDYNPTRSLALPRAGQTVKVGGTQLAWHALDSTGFDVKLFNFAQGLGKPKYGVVFHAVTVIDSPREVKNARLAVGSNSASMWWLNGEEAAGLFNDRRMVMDDVVSRRITLKKGRNILRGAVINGPGLSDFCVRFLDERGQPITDLSVSLL